MRSERVSMTIRTPPVTFGFDPWGYLEEAAVVASMSQEFGS
jgi:hypothetical protein